MEELRVIGVESGALIVASEAGTRFRVAVDDVLHARLRQVSPEPGSPRKLSPREIQAHIRGGMSAEDVAAVTGAPLDYVQRFEGPVLAEREFVIESALAVPVNLAMDTDPLGGGATFGSVIRRRLADARALGERWASWKEDSGGWVVKLTFSAETVEHDARWSFDPKKSTLAPLNQEALALSQQGDLPTALVPRLRAVPLGAEQEESRFDSGAFAVEVAETGPLAEPVPYGRSPEVPVVARNQTADLLEALRKRRGERDPMDPEPDDELASHPSTGTVRHIEVPITATTPVAHVDDLSLEPDVPAPRSASSAVDASTPDTAVDAMRTKPTARQLRENAAREQAAGRKRETGAAPKRGRRQSMPSWDEIVFGARADDDL